MQPLAASAAHHEDNLKANPQVNIEVGTDAIDVVASEADREERDRLYDAQSQRSPQFAEYQRKTNRVIPAMVLTPVNGA